MQKENFKIGILLILAAALGSSAGQLAWKFGTDSLTGVWWYILGFILAGAGALCMMVAFRFGEVSILQPMMSVGYVFSIFFGYLFLGEQITLMKILGTIFVIVGAIILGIPDSAFAKKKKKTKKGVK